MRRLFLSCTNRNGAPRVATSALLELLHMLLQCTVSNEIIYLRGASGGCLHGGASFRQEKTHFAARKKGSGEPQR